MNSTATPIADPKAKKRECWFETNLETTRNSVIRGYPDRIFDVDDPRWTKVEESKRPLMGSLIVGTVTRDGELFMQGTLRVEQLEQMNWERARELMGKFYKDGRTFDTPLADQVRQHEQDRKDGQDSLAQGIVTGLREAFAGHSVPAASDKKASK